MAKDLEELDDLPDDTDEDDPPPAKAKKSKKGGTATKTRKTNTKASTKASKNRKTRPGAGVSKSRAASVGSHAFHRRANYPHGTVLYGSYKGHSATLKVVVEKGVREYVFGGKRYASPSAAGGAFYDMYKTGPTKGWVLWSRTKPPTSANSKKSSAKAGKRRKVRARK